MPMKFFHLYDSLRCQQIRAKICDSDGTVIPGPCVYQALFTLLMDEREHLTGATSKHQKADNTQETRLIGFDEIIT